MIALLRSVRRQLSPVSLALGVVLALRPLAAAPVVAPDLAALPGQHGWQLVRRTAMLLDKDGAPAVHLAGSDGYGFARLENVTFGDGVIECDLRGKNLLQQSFVGLAFHGADDRTYDAVYFRPFNFRSDDPVRRTHAVQYISHPTHTWKKLRSEHPGRYEQPVAPVPDPDGWFHVRIVVAWPKISVFVDDAASPSLVVEQLSDRQRGWLALWTDVNGGDFANLKISPAPTVDPSSASKASADEAEFRRVVADYQRGLDGQASDALAELFTADGVALVQGAPASVGLSAVRSAYAALFGRLELALEFHVEETLPLAPDWALVRTSSHGTVKVRPNPASRPSAGHELFLLQRTSGGAWKIARYAASASR